MTSESGVALELRSLESRDLYTIGWIAALGIELAAARLVLDEAHGRPADFEQPQADTNIYHWGRIGDHNIVIASLPAGSYGTISAAWVASRLAISFPNARFGLMVGIGAGMPRPQAGKDVRLGDVVVSLPDGRSGGVLFHDMVKITTEGVDHRPFLRTPPRVFEYALQALIASHEIDLPKIPEYIEQAIARNKNPKMRRLWVHPGTKNDRLFKATYDHISGSTCSKCDPKEEIEREERGDTDPEIHYGVIASGNTLIKRAADRDRIFAELGNEECICFEMEAAGLMNDFPCTVIRGICDYADSHKNNQWQRYAALVAAAFAKEYLGHVHGSDILTIKTIRETLKLLEDTTLETNATVKSTEAKVVSIQEDEKARNFLRWLDAPDISTNLNAASSQRFQNTGSWFLESKEFTEWKTGSRRCLWLNGIPGSGKTVLSATIVNDLLRSASEEPCTTVKFFFDFNDQRKQSFAQMIRSLIKQTWLESDETQELAVKLYEDHDKGNYRSRFRWASCQLDYLKKCWHIRAIDASLKTLPATLHETYDRILKAIDVDPNKEIVVRIFQLLTFAVRPLTVGEVAEALAVDLSDSGEFNPDLRIPNPLQTLSGSSSLIVVGDEAENLKRHPDLYNSVEIQLAHFSVKEYFLSKHMYSSFRLAMEEKVANAVITKICLAAFPLSSSSVAVCSENAPVWLRKYSDINWRRHAESSISDPSVQSQVLRFITDDTAVDLWFKQSGKWISKTPIAISAWAGLASIVSTLLEQENPTNVAAEVDILTSALHAALAGDSLSAVASVFQSRNREILCNLLAKVINHWWATGNVVRLLIQFGADPNFDLKGVTVLMSCVERSEPGSGVDAILALLQHGANPNERSLFGAPMILSRLLNLSYAVDEMLILDAAGILSNVLGTRLPIAPFGPIDVDRLCDPLMLQRQKHCKVCSELHLEKEALDNKDIESFYPVQRDRTASLDSGSKVLGDDGSSTVLLAAIASRNDKAVDALIKHGSDFNTQNGTYNLNALAVAIILESDECATRLLKAGVDTSHRGIHPFCRTAFELAIVKGNYSLAYLIQEQSGHANMPDQEYRNLVHRLTSIYVGKIWSLRYRPPLVTSGRTYKNDIILIQCLGKTNCISNGFPTLTFPKILSISSHS
ncbi:hypothetical protein ABW19_dt0202748 [Dactylella cylindrospora]|nr:hypothetical protein ABW19_dt0202748 [Dactylella cylindrospora]